MGWWTNNVVPRVAERSLSAPAVTQLRTRACAGLHGRVLEIGFGSGLNVAHYPAKVLEVEAVEPSDVAWRLAQPRLASTSIPIVRSGLDGQRLTQGSGWCDAALSTFTMCTIPDLAQALSEVRRVLTPGGALHFVEHGMAPDTRVATWQRRIEPCYTPFAGGCRLSRDIPAQITAAGFEMVALETDYLPGPRPSRPFSYCYVGRARRTD